MTERAKFDSFWPEESVGVPCFLVRRVRGRGTSGGGRA
jgi:hypothetical protein